MSTLLHTVRFSKEVTFTDHTGVTFVNVTTRSLELSSISLILFAASVRLSVTDIISGANFSPITIATPSTDLLNWSNFLLKSFCFTANASANVAASFSLSDKLSN